MTTTARDVLGFDDADEAYEAWLQSCPDFWEQFLPAPLPREHRANRCDACEQFGTAENPVTFYAGAPPDLENGPHVNDLPFTLCEACETADGPF